MNLFLLFVAGDQTTRNALSGGVLEMRVTPAGLLERFPEFHLTGSVERLSSNLIDGIKQMPLALV